jgi:L-amino acid N-acyltransferase YncA
MAGFIPAIVCYFLSIFYPQKILDTYIEYHEARAKKTKDIGDYQVIKDWFILTNVKTNQSIGRFTTSTYNESRPTYLEGKLMVEVSLFLHPDYRGKHLASNLYKKLFKKLRKYEEYSNAVFCFRTRQENTIVHHVAENIGAKLVNTFESKKITSILTCVMVENLYVIPFN